MLSKISPAPLTAYLLPRTWILQSKFQISLNLHSPGKFFWLTLWESFWTQRKLFLFLAWKYFFSFYIPTLERKLGIGLETGKEGRESKGTWVNVLPFHCRKLLISRAVPVHSSVLQKTHQLCEFVSRFLLQSHCGSLWSRAPMREMRFPAVLPLCCLILLPPEGEGAHAFTVEILPLQPEKGHAYTLPIFLLYTCHMLLSPPTKSPSAAVVSKEHGGIGNSRRPRRCWCPKQLCT